MKKIHSIYSSMMFLALLLLAAPLVRAQGPQGGHHGHHMDKAEHRAKMQQELGLSEQQVAQFDAIHAKYDPQFKALRGEEGEIDHGKMHELHQSMRAELKQVLTEEQQAKLDSHRMEGMRHGGRGGHGMHGEGHHPGGKGDFGHHMGSRKGNKEVKAYMKENMLPVLKAQRAKLDAQMSPEDKATVEGLRSELKAMRPERKEFKAEKREFKKEGNQPSEAQRAEYRALREKRHAIMEQAGAIALKYQSQLEALHQEIQPQAEKWHADIQAIQEKYKDEKPEGSSCEKGSKGAKGHCEGKTEGADCKAHCEGQSRMGEGHRGHHRGEFGAMQRQRDAARFVLMDPASSSSKAAVAAEGASSSKLDIFPNPTANQNTISYEVKKAGKVKIELLDAKGQVVRQVLDTNREIGSYTLDVDLSSLSSGVYFYRITDASGARSKNFNVAK